MHRLTALAHRGLARTLALAIVLLGLILTVNAPSPAAARDRDVDFSEFYEALEPYGDWIEHRRYGYVWAPHAAEDEEWRPYTRGYWVPTEDHGWYWVSDEPFGWAVYHYGRWIDDEEFGWIWIPGYEWAPAWVAWRDGDDYIGWAPLPPEARWRGDRLVFSVDYFDHPRFSHYWVFAAPRYFGVPGMHRHILPRARSVTLLPRTRIVTHYHFHDRRIFNRGIDPRDLERRGGRQFAALRVVPGQSRHDYGVRRGDQSSIITYRPTFRPAPSGPVAPRVVLPLDRRETGAGDPARENRRGYWRRDRSNETVSSGNRPVVQPTEPSISERPQRMWRRGDGERREVSRPADGGPDRNRGDATRSDGGRGDGNRGDGNRWRERRFGPQQGATTPPPAPSTPPPAVISTPRPSAPSEAAPVRPTPPPAAMRRAEPPPPPPVSRQAGPPPELRGDRGRGGRNFGELGGGPSAGSAGPNRDAALSGGHGGGQRQRDGERRRTPPGERPPS